MNKIVQIVLIIVWFFILIGAIITTKICLCFIDQNDFISVVIGFSIVLTVWTMVVTEFIKTIKKYFK